jgi:16S rRNA (cytidine1402-2'-O)-methyltransferase
MVSIFGAERRAAVCRELTKQFETTYVATLTELHRQSVEDADMTRGEIVVVVSGSEASPSANLTFDAEQLLRALLEELPPSQAAKIAARITGEKRSELYEKAMSLRASGS